MQQGGSKYGVPPPEMTPFSLEVTGHRPQLVGGISGGQDNISNLPSQPNHQQQQQMAEAVPPINSKPPQPPPTAPNFEELASTVSGNFNDDDALTAGDDTERGPSGNRWPREETLALIKIRSEMDAVFRDATLKGPLWDEVSRKLAEQGYTRSAKKCKEKFENVHKYYKRTKEGRAGRQDGKSYRFFAQLEALNKIGGRSCNATTPPPPPPPTSGAAANPQSSSVIGFNSSDGNRYQPTPLSSMTPLTVTASGGPPELGLSSAPLPASGGGISFSTNSSSTSSSESDGEELAEGVVGRKRKRRSSAGGGGGSKKTMAYIKDLMKKLMDQQEAMQMRFLETIEKREHDRMIRDEAWKREEMTRITREHQAMASERAISATRDAAIIAFLQKITGQTIQLPQPIPISAVSVPEVSVSPPPPQQNTPPPPPPKQQQKAEKLQVVTPVTEGVVVVHDQEGNEMGIGTDPSSSRWPKMEVHALIKLRSEMESRYQDNGPKGPLWEEISAGMKRMGYNRNSKRCKEKWENINKYFKKVKESNKKRPEDAKTCPYFHQLDALYRKKYSSVVVSGGGISSSGNLPTNNNGTSNQEHELPSPRNSNVVRTDVLPISILPPPDPRENQNAEKMVGNGSSSNGDVPANFLGQNLGGTMTLKKYYCYALKPEDTVTEPNTEQQRRQSDVRMDDSDENIDDDNEDDEEEDDEEQKMAYKIEYQIRPTNNVTSVSNGGGTNPSSAAAGSFLAMVQ